MRRVSDQIVTKLWNLCNVLKDDGVTYHEYVNELTYLLFLKMARETGVEQDIPEGYRWNDLVVSTEAQVLRRYQFTLDYLGLHGTSTIRQIFSNSATLIRKPHTLKVLVAEIDKLDWYSAQAEGLGDIYEGLLERNAAEKKSGAGQYFTPRPLIDAMVAVTKPTLHDIIQDPAAGTGGFLIAASRYVAEGVAGTWSVEERKRFQSSMFFGMEHVRDTQRLALMNLMLHGLRSDPQLGGVRYGDTLSSDGQALPLATIILSNPPFGIKRGGGLPSRTDLPYPTSNKQLCFLQHIYGALKPGGKAAVVLPDNVLFEGNTARQVRNDLMDKCDLHTILKLPTGIFYAQGVSTNVLFLTRTGDGAEGTVRTWIYDLRTNIRPFGRKNTLTRQFFAPFEAAYGNGQVSSDFAEHRKAVADTDDRFICISRQEIRDREDNLSINWLSGQTPAVHDAELDPSIAVQEAIDELDTAILALRRILQRSESA